LLDAVGNRENRTIPENIGPVINTREEIRKKKEKKKKTEKKVMKTRKSFL
jgi:hypothetical protein